MDRLGFEPRTSCLQSRRSSADLPAPTRAQRRGADETFREDSRAQPDSTGLNAYPHLGDEGAVGRAANRALRWLVGVNVLVGGLGVLGGESHCGNVWGLDS